LKASLFFFSFFLVVVVFYVARGPLATRCETEQLGFWRIWKYDNGA